MHSRLGLSQLPSGLLRIGLKTEELHDSELRFSAHRLRRLRVQAIGLMLWALVRNGVLLVAAAALGIAVFILAPFAILRRLIDVNRLPLLSYVLYAAWFWILAYSLRPRLTDFDRLWKRWAGDVSELRDAISAAGIDLRAVRGELQKRRHRGFSRPSGS